MSPMFEFSNAEDIRNAIRSRADAYVPEWKFSETDPDGGAALALVFADMFGETAERMSRVPGKYFIYFLNMIGTQIKTVSPATGLAAFTLVESEKTGQRVPAGTQLYADVESDDGNSTRVVFEAESEITAVPSEIAGIYNVDPKLDVINAVDIESGDARLFFADVKENLQVHRFSIWNDDVLSLQNPALITVKPESGYGFPGDKRGLEILADSEAVSWAFVRNGIREPITKTRIKDNAVLLELDSLRPVQPEGLQPQNMPQAQQEEAQPQPEAAQPQTADAGNEADDLEMKPHLVCRFHPGEAMKEIRVDDIKLASEYLYRQGDGIHIIPDRVFYNDIELDVQKPGYVFSRQPNIYDTFLISSDEVFAKRGAQINIGIVMHTVGKEVGTAPEGPVYEWNGRHIIEKSEEKIVLPDNIFISGAVWEYWNDVGWASLRVEGTSGNPFVSDEDVRHEGISFTCPEDIAGSFQNSIWGYWIRVRITGIENILSQYAVWQLPFAESVSLTYSYGANLRRASALKLENNAEERILDAAAGRALSGSLYKPLVYPEHAVYIAFDEAPSALPLSLFIGFHGSGKGFGALSYERLCRDVSGAARFRACKVKDGTGGLKDSGLITMYIPKDMVKARIFGLEAYWLRIVDADMRYDSASGTPSIGVLKLNAVQITQKQTVEGEYFDTELFDSGKAINLGQRPILDCEVYTDESGDPGVGTAQPGVNYEYDAEGNVKRAWVKWDIVASMSEAGPDKRAVCLDAQSGIISFGNGINGRVPSAGTQNILVKYSYGGGEAGNLPAGAISGLVSGIDGIGTATNFTSTGGGSDRGGIRAAEHIGSSRLRHRGRAVTLNDFESIILEQFPEVAAARAFAGLDPEGRTVPSCVTVVLLAADTENRDQALKTCKNAYRFLAQHAHCQFIAAKRLFVIPALMMTVNATVEAALDDMMLASVTEREIQAAISGRLSGISYPNIGSLPVPADIFECLRDIPNLSYIDRVSLEGEYYENSRLKLVSLDKQAKYRFASVRDGTHIVRFI